MWFINNIYINHKLLELSVQAPRTEQLYKAAAPYMYTRHKVLKFPFLYSGGNNTCRTEQKTVKRIIRHKTVKQREQKIKDNRKGDWTQQRRTVVKDVESESCATPSKLLKIEHRKQNKRKYRKAKNTPEHQLNNKKKIFRLTNHITAQKTNRPQNPNCSSPVGTQSVESSCGLSTR